MSRRAATDCGPPDTDTGLQAHFAGLNIRISGRREVCPLDSTYVYMELGMLCVDEHTPKDRYWYPNRSYTGLEIVFDLDRLSQKPIPELSAYCDYDSWVRHALENHGGLYTMVNGGETPVRDRAYVTKGQKAIADDVERRITEDLSRHEPISFYLRGKRMDLAKQRLAQTKDSVGSIAADCGYASQGKFGAVFRECTGMYGNVRECPRLSTAGGAIEKQRPAMSRGKVGTRNEFE